jgi:nitroreductase/NAD-dependent dihydropyrimidine dehydrogenase PreA subunit
MKEVNLSINTESCIKCGKCVKVCPAKIIKQSSKDAPVIVESSKGCISCGHCVAVCPTASVIHSEFPVEKVHPIDYALYPTAEQMMLLIKARRSNRVFSNKPIPEASLDLILEAGHRAPTASNQQQVGFTLITEPEHIRMIIDFTVSTFNEAAKKLENPFLKPILKRMMPMAYRYLPVLERMKNELQKGNDPILRKATAVILIHSPKSNSFGVEDSNLAYQNASLMAETLGISQFYTGFILMAIRQDKKGKLANLLGIDGKVCAGMALGMPQFRYPNYIDRVDIDLKKL